MYIKTKPTYNEIVFTDKQMQEIKALYLSGNSSVKIGKMFGCGHKTILKALHRMGVNVDQKKLVRKYQVDETYFDVIDEPNKAYILGFLWADGHNGISKGTVTMSLQEEDGYILECIRKKLKSERPLEYLDYSNKYDFGYHYKNQYRLNIFSAHMCNTLNSLGMVPNKSLVLEFPTIPSELYPHFIRGYFDGDGSINKNSGSFNIISTKTFVLTVNEILEDSLHVSHGIIAESSCKNGITYDLHYHRKTEAKIIFDWLYKDAELYLERKYEAYKEIHCKDPLIA